MIVALAAVAIIVFAIEVILWLVLGRHTKY
jgi:hypothetical protein